MHKFYKSSLVLLASIVCISAYCSDGEKKQKKGLAQAFKDAISRKKPQTMPTQPSATPALSSQADKEKEQKKKIAAGLGDEQERNASIVADELTAIRDASCYYSGAIDSFKAAIPYDNEWELFCSGYQHKPHIMAGAIQYYYSKIAGVNENSSLQDIVSAYGNTLITCRALSNQSSVRQGVVTREDALWAAEVSVLSKALYEKGKDEAFKQYEKEREKVEIQIKLTKEMDTSFNEAHKKRKFVAAMIKKHNITLSAPFKHSDFE